MRTARPHHHAGLTVRSWTAGLGRVSTSQFYFTAPLVMPEMIFRWAMAKTTINGRLIRIT